MKRLVSNDTGLFAFLRRVLRCFRSTGFSHSRSRQKARLWIAEFVARFCTQSGPNSHLSLTLAPFGLSGVGTSRPVVLGRVAFGKRFAQSLHDFKPGDDQQARFRPIPENLRLPRRAVSHNIRDFWARVPVVRHGRKGTAATRCESCKARSLPNVRPGIAGTFTGSDQLGQNAGADVLSASDGDGLFASSTLL